MPEVSDRAATHANPGRMATQDWAELLRLLNVQGPQDSSDLPLDENQGAFNEQLLSDAEGD